MTIMLLILFIHISILLKYSYINYIINNEEQDVKNILVLQKWRDEIRKEMQLKELTLKVLGNTRAFSYSCFFNH